MAYLDIAFPECIAFGAMTGVEWQVAVTRNEGGFEQRTASWLNARHSYDIGFAVRTADDYAAIKKHWNETRGQLHSFPFRDPLDHSATISQGIATDTTTPGVFQLYKDYGGLNSWKRKITRPAGATVKRNGTTMTPGIGAGQYTLDPETGKLTVAPDQSRAIDAHTPGTTHRVQLASAFAPNVSIGSVIYLSGITGTASTLLNGVALTVTAVTTNMVNLNVNTTGLTASVGIAARRISAGEITWSGEFNVPCRYGIDKLPGAIVNRVGGSGQLLVQCDSIQVIEVKE